MFTVQLRKVYEIHLSLSSSNSTSRQYLYRNCHQSITYILDMYHHSRVEKDFLVIFIHQQNGSNNIIVNKKKSKY